MKPPSGPRAAHSRAGRTTHGCGDLLDTPRVNTHMTATTTERPTQTAETTAAATRRPPRPTPTAHLRRHDRRHGRRHGHGRCRRRHRIRPHVRLLRPGRDHHGRGHLRRHQPPPGPLSVGNSTVHRVSTGSGHAPQATQDPDPARQGTEQRGCAAKEARAAMATRGHRTGGALFSCPLQHQERKTEQHWTDTSSARAGVRTCRCR